ncbi:hypothetical protein CGRA01v4_02481 [Colletotrichum graminicola]|nr:hypothetical protein CGRA01v4_02481 [Colletotrichum graminicola]
MQGSEVESRTNYKRWWIMVVFTHQSESIQPRACLSSLFLPWTTGAHYRCWLYFLVGASSGVLQYCDCVPVPPHRERDALATYLSLLRLWQPPLMPDLMRCRQRHMANRGSKM